MKKDELNEVIDRLLKKFTNEENISLLAVLDKEFPNIKNEKALRIISKMEEYELVEDEDDYGFRPGYYCITDRGETVLEFGGWINYLKMRDSKDIRESIKREEDEELDRSLKLQSYKQQKWFWPILIISNLFTGLVAIVASNLDKVIEWFK
ncbi:MAG: hypothetical protein ABI663_04865 [Chryseolinea sp.]